MKQLQETQQMQPCLHADTDNGAELHTSDQTHLKAALSLLVIGLLAASCWEVMTEPHKHDQLCSVVVRSNRHRQYPPAVQCGAQK